MFDNLISLFIIASLGVFFQLKKPGNPSPAIVINKRDNIVTCLEKTLP